MTQELNAYYAFTKNGKFLLRFDHAHSPDPLENAKQLAWCYSGYVIHNGLVVADYRYTFDFPM